MCFAPDVSMDDMGGMSGSGAESPDVAGWAVQS